MFQEMYDRATEEQEEYYPVEVTTASSPEYIESLEGTKSLLERNYAGLNVEVRWAVGTDSLLLCVARGDERYAAVIEGKDAQDAFEHPYVYLAASGVEFLA